MQLKRLVLVLGLMAPISMLAACEEDGPFEEAGEEIDQSMDNMDDSAEELGEDIDDATGQN